MNPQSDAEFVGRIIGLILFGGAVVYGLAKCASIIRRPTTSSLCVVSLMAFLVVWLIGMIVQVVSPGSSPDAPFLKMAAWALMMLIAFTGFILGLTGLLMYGPRNERFQQGRKQGWWGLVMNGLIVVIFLAGLGRTLWLRSEMNTKSAVVSPTGTPNEVIDVPNNFKISLPGGNWKKQDSKMFGESVKLLVGKFRPEIYQMITVEEIGEDLTVGLDAAVTLWKSGIEGSSTRPEFTPERRETIGGQEFVHFTATAMVEKMRMKFAYDCWATIQAGRCYRLMTYGSSTNHDEIEVIGGFVARSFRVLKPGQAKPAVAGSVVDVTNHPWGFSTRLAGAGWKVWPGTAKNFPGAVFAAYQPNGSYLGIVPLPIQSTTVDLPTAAEALLATNGGISWNEDIKSRTAIEIDGADEAIKASLDQIREGVPIHYEIRVVRAGNRFLLLLAWSNTQLEKDPRVLLAALDSISLNPLEKLPDFAQLTREQREKMSLSLHQCGLAAHKRQEYQQSASLFVDAFDISQYNPRTLESAASMLGESGRAQAGLDLLKKYEALFPGDQAIAVTRAFLEEQLNDPKGADRLLEVFKSGYRNEDDLLKAVGVLLGRGRAAETVPMIENYLKGGASARGRRLLAIACEQAGDVARAMELLEKQVNETPFDVETGYRYGETANNSAAHDKATAIVARLIKEGFDGARTRLIEGWAFGGRNQWREAKASFEKAAKFAPNEPVITEAIARASSALGEGDNSSLKNPLTPLPLPGPLAEQMTKAAAMPAAGDASAQYLSRVTLYQYKPDQPLVTTSYQDVRLIDAGAIPDFRTLVYPFDPLSEEIYVNSVVVSEADGTEVARVKPEEQYIIDESSSSAMATHRKELRIAVPGLKAGRVIHVVVTRRDKSGEPVFPWQRMVFASTIPCNLDAVVVMADPKSFKAAGNAFFEKTARIDRSGDRWQAVISPVPRFHLEPTLPMIDSFLPILHLGPAKSDWVGIAKDFRKEIEDRLKPEESVTALARRLTESLTDDTAKIRALARHVQSEITYQGLEFGRRARRPNFASQVLACHYGDCKDQALLLHQMLTAVGIPSNLALVSTNYDVVDAIPSLDQFNHMIVHVPGLPCRFIDTTGIHNPAGYLPPDLGSTHALVLDAVKPAIVAFPEDTKFPSDEVVIDRKVVFDPSGAAKVNEKLRITGYYALSLRSYFAARPKEQRLAAFQDILREKSSSQLEEFDLTGLEEVGGPLDLTLGYRVPADQGGMRVPAIIEESLLAVSYDKARHHPFRFYHGMNIKSTTTVQTPEPLGADALAAFERRGDGPFLKWEIARKSKDTLKFEAFRPLGSFPASEHAAWFESSQKVLNALKTPID